MITVQDAKPMFFSTMMGKKWCVQGAVMWKPSGSVKASSILGARIRVGASEAKLGLIGNEAVVGQHGLSHCIANAKTWVQIPPTAPLII